ncbi:TolB family protein [Gemmatimonadota bacterium]
MMISGIPGRLLRIGFPFLALMSLACGKQSTEPDQQVPLDGRGGGVIAYSITPPDGNNEIWLMNADGSALQAITDSPHRDAGPAWSPDGSQIAFYTHQAEHDMTWSLWIMDADGSGRQRLTDGYDVRDAQICWSPDGTRILFSRNIDTTFELWLIDPDGTDATQISGINGGGPDWCAANGRIVYNTANSEASSNAIVAIDPDGANPDTLISGEGSFYEPVWSPDGSRIAYSFEGERSYNIWVMNADGSDPVQLTDNDHWDSGAEWSPDGSQILFCSMRNDNFELYLMNADGTDERKITTTSVHAIQPAWRP